MTISRCTSLVEGADGGQSTMLPELLEDDVDDGQPGPGGQCIG